MCMHYMMDIETHTVIYLRDLLATRAANDPYVTAFLSCWVYEELWHGEAFSDFLRAYGIEVPAEPKLPDGSTPMPTRPNRVQQLRTELGRRPPALAPADDARLGDDEGLRRDPHGLGRDQRADHADRLLPADPPLGASRPAPDAPAGHPGRAAPFRVLPRAGEGAARRTRRAARGGWCAGCSRTSGPRSGRASRARRRSTRSRCTCSATGPRAGEAIRELDATIAEIPGLEGLHLLEGVLDDALARAPRAARAPRSSRSSRRDPRGAWRE